MALAPRERYLPGGVVGKAGREGWPSYVRNPSVDGELLIARRGRNRRSLLGRGGGGAKVISTPLYKGLRACLRLSPPSTYLFAASRVGKCYGLEGLLACGPSAVRLYNCKEIAPGPLSSCVEKKSG